MAVRILSYDTATLPQGERVVILDGESPPRFDDYGEIKNRISNLEFVKDKIYFNDLRYLEFILDKDIKFDVWEVIKKTEEYELTDLVTHTLIVSKRKTENEIKIILRASRTIKDGYVQFY